MTTSGYGSFLGDVAELKIGGTTWIPVSYQTDFGGQFVKAWEACNCTDQFQAWDCSRRSAKTGTAVRRTVMRSSERQNHRTLYIHRTRELAKMQFFQTGEAVGSKANPGVMELLARHNITEARHDLSELWVRLTNGSFAQAIGCDDERDVDKKLGYQWDDIIIDECQDQNDSLLRRLVDKTLLPTLIDRGGTLTLLGTPPEVEDGLWHEVSNPNGGSTFTRLHWTLLDNPFIDRADLIKVYEGRGFKLDFADPTNNHPVVQREIFGLHVVDPESMLYEYVSGPEFNDWPVAGIPFVDSSMWRCSIGIDIGGLDETDDNDAIVVLGWRMDDPKHEIWERESWTGKADSEEFLARVAETFKRWPIQAGCGDAGADKMLEYFKKRMNGLALSKKPSDLDVSQRLLNDEFRSRRLKLNPIGCVAKAARKARKGRHEPDALAACRYAYHAAYSYMGKDMTKKNPAPKTSAEIDEELDRRRMARFAEDRRYSNSAWKSTGGWNT
jgi:hypothetical protein